jgi:hypothetical protein
VGVLSGHFDEQLLSRAKPPEVGLYILIGFFFLMDSFLLFIDPFLLKDRTFSNPGLDTPTKAEPMLLHIQDHGDFQAERRVSS